MTDTSTDTRDPGLVIMDRAVAAAPQEAYREVRARCPVARSEVPGLSGVYIFDYESVQWALRHPEVFSSSSDALSIGQEQPLIPLQMDPPVHTTYRRLLNPPFNPRRINELEPDVRSLVRSLIDGFADAGHCDFHEDFATPLPSTIFLRLMGLPQSDLPMFLQWRDNTVRPDVDPHDLEAAAAIREETGKAVNAYFERAIEAARAAPGDGLLGELVQQEVDGRPLNQTELLGMCHLLLLAGLDTVTATLDCMVAYLARHPDHRRELAADLDRFGPAVDELLRYESPVTLVPRVIRQPVTLQGVDLAPGESVMLSIGSANVDETEFHDPMELDWSRPASRHVAFGGGNHRCLGAHLARLELRVGLEEFHARIPDYRVPDDVELHFSPGIRQADHLPLVWDSATDDLLETARRLGRPVESEMLPSVALAELRADER